MYATPDNDFAMAVVRGRSGWRIQPNALVLASIIRGPESVGYVLASCGRWATRASKVCDPLSPIVAAGSAAGGDGLWRGGLAYSLQAHCSGGLRTIASSGAQDA